MESSRKLDGRHTTANDRIQRMRNLWTNKKTDDSSNYLLCKTDLSHVISGNVERLESFRQRRSARYALEWLDSIKPESRDLKLDSGDKKKNVDVHFVKRKTLNQSLSRSSPGVQNYSVNNFGKYHENLKESRRMRSRINDSFLRCWHPLQQQIDVTRMPEESRDLVPSKNGKIFRYKEKHIEVLSVDEMVTSDEPHSGSRHERSNIDLCHPFLQPFLNEKGNLRNGQNSIRVDEMSGEAVVIYRRNGHNRIDDWKNYQIEQFAFGKAKFGLRLDTETKRSSSETRHEKTSMRTARVTRRRRSKFRYEPVKIGRSVSIEFKKFDEIREMFHPDKSSPIFRCSRNDNAYFWKSNEFRLKSSAEKKLNLFKEMKKKERYRRRRFQEAVPRSLNYRCATAESFSTETVTTEDGGGRMENTIGERITEDLEISRSPIHGKAKDEEYKSSEALFEDDSLKTENNANCPDTPRDIPKDCALNKLRDILDELVENGDLDVTAVDDVAGAEQPKVNPANRTILMNLLKKNDAEITELEEVILRLQVALRDCHGVLVPVHAGKEGKVPEKEFPSETGVPPGCQSIIAYPISTVNKDNKPSRHTRMELLKQRGEMLLHHGETHMHHGDSLKHQMGIGRTNKMLESVEIFPSQKTLLSASNTFPDNKSNASGTPSKSAKSTESGKSGTMQGRKAPISEKSWKSEKSASSNASATSKLNPESLDNLLGERRGQSNLEPTQVVEGRIMQLEGRLKKLLRRVKVYPAREQDAIKKCLERLKDTSDAVLKRLRGNNAESASASQRPGQRNRAKDIIQRGYQSEPESAVKMNTDERSVIFKTSGSEIQLNVGMEITMENFDPVTGKKLRPEENKDFQQEGNIQCKIVKPGEKPVTFIDTNFLYNPKTGMLFKGDEHSLRKSKQDAMPLKPTRTYLISNAVESPYPSNAESDLSPERKHRSGEFSGREGSSEGFRPSNDSRYKSQGTSPDTSKSAESDPFRLAIEREEMRNASYLEDVKRSEFPSANSPRTPAKRSNQKKISLRPILMSTTGPGQDYTQGNVMCFERRAPEQAFHLQEAPQGNVRELGSQRKAAATIILNDKFTQTNLCPTKYEDQSEVARMKSTGVQAELRERMLVRRDAETSFHTSGTSAHKRVQTLSSEYLSGRRKASDNASQTSFSMEDPQKYLKDLETQKRVNLAIAELCYHLSNNSDLR